MVWSKYNGLDSSCFAIEEMCMAVSLNQLSQSVLQDFE
jgi:hypothetical protein